MYYCSLVLQDHYWPWMEQLEVLPSLDADSLSKFVPMMLSKAFLECYIAGLCRNNFLKMIFLFLQILFFGLQLIADPPLRRERREG